MVSLRTDSWDFGDMTQVHLSVTHSGEKLWPQQWGWTMWGEHTDLAKISGFKPA